MEPTEEQYARALDFAEQMLGFRLESFLVPQDGEPGERGGLQADRHDPCVR